MKEVSQGTVNALSAHVSATKLGLEENSKFTGFGLLLTSA